MIVTIPPKPFPLPRWFVVEAHFDGQWVCEASGFATRSAARRYIRACKFWDGFPRRVRGAR